MAKKRNNSSYKSSSSNRHSYIHRNQGVHKLNILKRAGFDSKSLVDRLHSFKRNLSFKRLVTPVHPQRPLPKPIAPKFYNQTLHFNDKKDTICAKRAIRKEVMHALGKAGGSVSPPRYNQNSKVRCK